MSFRKCVEDELMTNEGQGVGTALSKESEEILVKRLPKKESERKRKRKKREQSLLGKQRCRKHRCLDRRTNHKAREGCQRPTSSKVSNQEEETEKKGAKRKLQKAMLLKNGLNSTEILWAEICLLWSFVLIRLNLFFFDSEK